MHGHVITMSMSYTAIPSPPRNLTVDSISYSWVSISWLPPNYVGKYGVSQYEVVVRTLLSDVRPPEIILQMQTDNNETQMNITGLQEGMEIHIQATAITSVGEVSVNSLESQLLTLTTSTRGKCGHVVCNIMSLSM